MSDADFTSHVRANYDRWLRFVRRLVRQHAEDVVQTTVLKLWAVREDIDAGRIDRLAFTVLRQTAIDQWRKESRRPVFGQEIRDEVDDRTPDKAVNAREADQIVRARLAQARGALSARQRQALAVWLLWHPSREEASVLLGVTMSAYSAAVFSALRKLNQSLTPHQDALAQAQADLGSGSAFAVLAQVFETDLPQKA